MNKEALLLFIAGEWIGALQTKALIPIVSGHARAWNNAEIQEAADRGGVTDLYVNNVNGVRLWSYRMSFTVVIYLKATQGDLQHLIDSPWHPVACERRTMLRIQHGCYFAG